MEYPASFQSSGNRVFEKVGRVFFLGGEGWLLVYTGFFHCWKQLFLFIIFFVVVYFIGS